MKVGTDGVLLGAWAKVPSFESGTGDTERKVDVLDVGTGTGVVALMMAQRYPNASIMAIDIDEGAVQQAEENVAASPFFIQVTVRRERVQDHDSCYDAIVCNPPFFIDSLAAPDKQRNMARHADTLTYAELMEAAWRLLRDDGELSIVVPFDYRQRMEDEATFRGFFPSRVCAVRTVAGRPARRYLLAFRKHPCERPFETMTIGDDNYKQLTKDFYL